jgi:CRISPR-associated protein (TIGR03984 family)
VISERAVDTLFRWRRPGCPWKGAGPASAGAVGLLYTPDAVIPVRSDGLAWQSAVGAVGVAGVFEARIWTDQWDLRWVEDEPGSGLGTATLFSEDDDIGLVGEPPERLPVHATFDHRYLVWGVVDETTGDWATTSAARVGAIAVPVSEAAPGDRLVLDAREYLGVIRDNGLCGPVAERLMGFRRDASKRDDAGTRGEG